jgi:7-cyano-7-deazaguanine synthase in queuosine biosynthesis
VRKAPRPESQELDLDIGEIAWHGAETIGAHGFSARSLDFLEIARLVWEVERHTPKRISSQRVRSVHVTIPLREPAAWTVECLSTLSSILRLLGNAEWRFEVSKRTRPDKLDELASRAPTGLGEVPVVALFSGGLDSTSGLSWLRDNGVEAALASFYGHRAMQAKLAQDLGFNRHVQVGCTWSGGRRRFGGQFQYRSLLFLALGAAVARSFGAGTLMQFENGPLAIALPPSRTYRMTRHAHPLFHRLAERLLPRLFESPMAIQNPFLTLTKREAVDALRARLGGKGFTEIATRAETCWNLASRQVIGSIGKAVGQPCGLCIPCVVRRTALPDKDVDHAVDLTSKKSKHFADPNARIHVDAYLAWARKVINPSYSAERFTFEAPQVLRDAVTNSGGALSTISTFDLYRRFAIELVKTFPAL